MRSIYFSDKKLGSKFVVAKAETERAGDIIIHKLTPDMELVDALKMFLNSYHYGVRCWIYACGNEDFQRDVTQWLNNTSMKLFYSVGQLEDALKEDMDSFTEFSVEKCVVQTARNYGIQAKNLEYLAYVVERNIKKHSVYAIMFALLGIFKEGDLNHTKFEAQLKYFIEVFKKVRNSESVFESTQSQCLAVLAANGHPYFKSWEKFERFSLSVLLRPYGVDESVDKRVDIVVRTVKEAM